MLASGATSGYAIAMATLTDIRHGLHCVMKSRDFCAHMLKHHREDLTPDEVRKLAAQLAEFDGMITSVAKTLSGQPDDGIGW